MLHTGMFCAAMWLNARMGMLSSCFIIQDLLVMTLFSAGLCFVVIFFFLGGRRELCMMMVLKKVHGNCTAVGCVGVNMSLKTGSVG